MLSLSGSCILPKVNLTVIKKKSSCSSESVSSIESIVTDENYRRSPLSQGGLEIPVEVICEMNDAPRNRAIMERFKTLVTRHYKEPRQDCQFDDCTKDVLEELCEDDYLDVEEELEASLDTD